MKIHTCTGRTTLLAGILVSAALLAGCGERKRDATQVAARINKQEITVHQINFALQREPLTRPENLDATSRRILEQLIDQEVAVQQALEQKLDRDPRVVQAIEAARREVLARAYADKVASTAPKATEEEIKSFYANNPELFKGRRIYSLQEILVAVPGDQATSVKSKLSAAKDPQSFAQSLQAAGVRFTAAPVIRAPEQLPYNYLKQFAAAGVGDAVVIPDGPVTKVYFVAGMQPAPAALSDAEAAIRQFITNRARNTAVAENIKSLRGAATVAYVGKFAEGAPATAASAPEFTAPVPLVPSSGAVTAAPAMPSAVPIVAASAPRPEPAAPPASVDIPADVIKKGLGIK